MLGRDTHVLIAEKASCVLAFGTTQPSYVLGAGWMRAGTDGSNGQVCTCQICDP